MLLLIFNLNKKLRVALLVGAALSSRQAAMAQNTSGAPGTIVLSPIVIEAPANTLQNKVEALDQSRDGFLLPKIGATSFALDSAAIQSLPQGKDTPIDKLVLQTPGISYDSAVSNPAFHIRNEYANTQTRINGIMLPEGVSGLGPVLETGFIGHFDLLTGALPAQYGLRTAGVLDLTTKSEFAPGGSVSVNAGSFNTFSPSFEYSGSGEKTQYYFTGRYMQNDQGLENSTPSAYAIHDKTEQGKYFGYVSTLLGDSRRLTFMSGASDSRFQIPNTPGQAPLGDFGPAAFDSTLLNENERDTFLFNILALQTKGDDFDTQLSVFSRYADTHFVPDTVGDLIFNDVASDVQRKSLLNGVQFDGSKRLNEVHTLRAGFGVAAEQTNVDNNSTVLPGAVGAVTGPPITITDANSKLGWNLGVYLQDEWKLTDTLTLNTGVRFDQLSQFVDENQVSPRIALVDEPFENTSLHIGYARYFTPPMQAQATQTNLSLFANTLSQPDVSINDPVKPERSHYFDVGVDQKLLPGLTVGLDAYYKIATDLIDDGQFGQAVVLTQFNWARGYSEGAEAKIKYQNGNFSAYANFAFNITRATDPISNQYLLDPDEYAFLLTHYHYTDDMQMLTGSAGASYRWDRTLFSINMKYGSGLPSGFANSSFNEPYVTANLGIAHEIQVVPGSKPLTVRFDVVNLFDKIYAIRDGSGIGVFAPQFGQRRGFYLGLSQKL